MFGFVNVGERAGSGVDKIMTAWAEQNWKKPEFDFSERSDRVTLKLEVGQVVYIPGAADIRNENTNQEKATAVSKEDKILEYIRQNGSISSQKAAEQNHDQRSDHRLWHQPYGFLLSFQRYLRSGRMGMSRRIT